MLEARGISVAFGRRRAVVAADLDVGAGELVALCGPNGSGKSTLIGALAGDIAPGAGEAVIGGEDVRALSAAHLALRRAALEQNPSLAAPFSVFALAGLAIPLAIPPAEAVEIVRRALDSVGLADRASDGVAALSGGQQRRAHLARALAQLDAGRRAGFGRALLLDEPTAGLDFSHQIGAMRAARVAADEGAAVLVALHDLSLAAAFADRIVLMQAGRVVADEAPRGALAPDRLSDVYETPMRLFDSPDGALCVAPVYPGTPPLRGNATEGVY
ncbi:ATP-binding cassette domain-containing protein [Pikeienuella piscinae]|uniref:ATP-binding cassette domain-containing protein n=1 Tax=Pikeienuella piscinae TaxID=2748098 RepID=A0A7L5BXQ8_9RHOB|nr:ATP-binding cassette domain-containing protein [Pikeienuella piscinae]QIE55628.1 ATP-binding cassette domain-containing protein [Pikeienuella piscinae]